jgi:hypothetical protein
LRSLNITVRFGVIAGALSAPLAAAVAAGPAVEDLPRAIDRADYADRLRAFWLGQCIANWTGLRTEGRRNNPPFLTDADWGTQPAGILAPLDFVTSQDPWGADDDTDIEYVYLHLLDLHSTTTLTPEQIAAGWIPHINRFIWVSNERARQLMGRSALPGATGMLSANDRAHQIDAQLTTEFFGVMAPGTPHKALAMADLPIRTTAAAYAAHASQFYAALYSLAPVVDRTLPARDQVIWMVERAREFLPNTSKSANVVDFVLSDFLVNPDPDDWESTRDKIHLRYQANAATYGWIYRGFTESTVNFATGLMAFLYGSLDYRRTVEIGTLSGWDSDNGTATMGAIVAFMIGYDELLAQFPGIPLSDRYWILRTRDALPDYLPADPAAEDTFTLMAERMLPITEAAIIEAGGRVDDERGLWLLAPEPDAIPLELSPTKQIFTRSANNRVRTLGGAVTPTSSVPGLAFFFSNGNQHRFSGVEEDGFHWQPYSTLGVTTPGQSLTLTVTYSMPVSVASIRLVEGDHIDNGVTQGGWFDSITSFEALISGVWTPLSVTQSTPLNPSVPFQIIDFDLAAPVTATAIRLTGVVGGSTGFVNVAEIDAFAPPVPPPAHRFDFNADDAVDLEDLLAWEADPVDLDGDASATEADRRYLGAYLRWTEAQDISAP